MGVWYDQKIEGEFLRVSFHPSLPFLAAPTLDGRFHVFGEDAQRIDSIDIKKESAPGLLCWHPTRKILAMSWANGADMMWLVRSGWCANIELSRVDWTLV